MPDRDVRVRRSPFELMICLSAVLSSASWLSGVAPAPGSAADLMPGWVLWAWYLQLLPGGAVGLAAAVWSRRRLVRVLQLSGVAMIFLGSALTMFTIAIFFSAGRRGIGGGILIAAWAIAVTWRGLQIRRDLRIIRQSDGELDLHTQEPP